MSTRPISDAQAERFKRLVWPEMPAVLRSAGYLARNSATAEDLAQETMIKAMRAVDSYRDGTDMKAWLLTILYRTHIDRLRSKARRPHELSLDAEEVDLPAKDGISSGQHDIYWSNPEEMMEQFDDEAVIESLRMLPADIRRTVLLIDVERFECAEVAKILGVAVGTIKSRTHRGRAMLRDHLFEIATKQGWECTKEGSL